jgi:hypothetical protein
MFLGGGMCQKCYDGCFDDYKPITQEDIDSIQ